MFSENKDEYSHSFTFYCDACGYEMEFHTDELKEATQNLRDCGGKVVYDEDLKEYYHYCPDCI